MVRAGIMCSHGGELTAKGVPDLFLVAELKLLMKDASPSAKTSFGAEPSVSSLEGRNGCAWKWKESRIFASFV